MDVTDGIRIRLAAESGPPQFICPDHSQPMRNEPELKRFYCEKDECKRQISYQEVQKFRNWLLGKSRSPS